MLRRVKCESAVMLIVLAALADSGRAEQAVAKEPSMAQRVAQYAPVRLTADLSGLSAEDKNLIPHLITAAQTMDEIFWLETYGDREKLLSSLGDPAERRLAQINYGPWERLNDNRPFVAGVGPKPPGARFYPEDLTREHIIPFAQNGVDTWMNVVTACRACNHRKSSRTPEQAHMPLLYTPYVPSLWEDFILRNRRILADQMEFLMAHLPKNSRLHA